MSDIELVIKVPEELLEYFANHNCMNEDGWFSHSSKLLNAFRNGIPLPKGHGDLIDREELKTHFIGTEQGTDLEVYLEPTIINAPPIIKADKVAKEN